jgi:NAD(P)H-dependent flavin oxidoreductase YrpB (nitropropane dioxygenase family)
VNTSLRTSVCKILGCDVPIVLAGMGGVARSELVSAVTLAGGFGFLGMVRETAALIRQEVESLRASTDRPFGVNLIPAATPLRFRTRDFEAMALYAGGGVGRISKLMPAGDRVAIAAEATAILGQTLSAELQST